MMHNIQINNSKALGATLKVGNVSRNVSPDTLFMFFSSAGKVVEVQPSDVALPEGNCGFLVTFQEPETARFALATMNGLSLGGSKLKIESLNQLRDYRNGFPPPFTPRAHAPQYGGASRRPETEGKVLASRFLNNCQDNASHYPYPKKDSLPHQRSRHCHWPKTEVGESTERKNCNLYILNLSLDMTNDGLKAIMKEHGEVKHVCVLATLDNAGRRRAFVDMATPEEAALVVQRLHGRRIQGYELHISYAFVQRSGGPGMSLDSSSATSPNEQRRSAHHQLSARSPPFHRVDEHEQNFPTRNSLSMLVAREDSVPTTPFLKPRMPFNPFATAPLPFVENKRDSPFPSPTGSCEGLEELCTLTSLGAPFADSLGSYLPCTMETDTTTWTLFVSNVSPVACIDSDDLFRLFMNEGLMDLKSANLNLDLQNGMSLGNGTLTFNSHENYQKAFEVISGKNITLDGVKIKCEKLVSAHSVNSEIPYSARRFSPVGRTSVGLPYSHSNSSSASTISTSATFPEVNPARFF